MKSDCEGARNIVQLTIYFSPAEVAAVQPADNDVYIVIDVIRATTTLTTILERGASYVLIADTLEQAQQAAQRVPGRLLCGERNALPLPGFDYGNSPAQFSQLDLIGRELILSTTNGTRAFFACPEQSVRLAGCFYNAEAVCARALHDAEERQSNIAIVCAAEKGYFALDDATCAGYLALELQRQHPALQVHESVLAATALYHTYTPPKLLEYCNSARSVRKAGLQEDLEFCMRVSQSSTVPQVLGRDAETGLLMIGVKQ
jgi:2-phosphosulfolactate phosphatase